MDKRLVKKVTWPPPGKYILAVSGGIDSVCLMDIFARAAKSRGYELVVAHFDHGMRIGSATDAKFVKKLASSHGLEFATSKGRLGVKASEASARAARYKFLRGVQKRRLALSVLTAQHQDDALETAIFNAGRGATHFGLTPMHLNSWPQRPLLKISKVELLAYARTRKLIWHEDPTNQNPHLSRNFIRRVIKPRLKMETKRAWQNLIAANRQLRDELDRWLEAYGQIGAGRLSIKKTELRLLKPSVQEAVLRQGLRLLALRLENNSFRRLVHFCRIGARGSHLQLNPKLRAAIADDMITLVKIRGEKPSDSKEATL